MKKISFFAILYVMLFCTFTACNAAIIDYVHNVSYIRLKPDSSLAVVYWDELEGADEYILYCRPDPSSYDVKKIGVTKNNVFGDENGETLYVSTEKSYGVVAVVSGKETFCSKFVKFDETVTYENLY